MIDGGDLPFEENIALTKRVVECAHSFGVAGKGQVGKMDSSWAKEAGYKRRDPLEPEGFVQKTQLPFIMNGRYIDLQKSWESFFRIKERAKFVLPGHEMKIFGQKEYP